MGRVQRVRAPCATIVNIGAPPGAPGGGGPGTMPPGGGAPGGGVPGGPAPEPPLPEPPTQPGPGQPDVVKLEVKAPTAGRSGLLAAQLKGSPSPSSPFPLSASIDSPSSRKRNGKPDSPKATLATVDELSSASVESATSNARLPVPVSPSSGNTSPLAVPAKRQNTHSWGNRPAAEDEFVPPHLMSARTLPSDFVYAEDARPGSVLEGIGRKLRGSDAFRFRESVMRQTGFLEPQSLQQQPAD
ncbi:hypothetical protein WJX79_007350 [Trebouxia sp. C0005]